MIEEYRRLTAELAGAESRYRTELADAGRSDVDGRAALDAAVAEAAAAMEAARASAAAAAAAVAVTDREAARLWRELGALLGGRAGRRLGPLPPPGWSTVDGGHLERAAAALATARRRGTTTAVPPWFLAGLPVLGAACSAVAVFAVRGLLGSAGHHVALTVLGQVLLFLAPFVGLPALLAVSRHEHGRAPDLIAIGLTVLGGMLASCAITVTVH